MFPYVRNTLQPVKNGRYPSDENFEGNVLSENMCIVIQISLKFVHGGLIVSKKALCQVMTPHRWYAITWINDNGPVQWSMYVCMRHQRPPLLTWSDFNPSMNNQLHPL